MKARIEINAGELSDPRIFRRRESNSPGDNRYQASWLRGGLRNHRKRLISKTLNRINSASAENNLDAGEIKRICWY
jgi:hypothetical protein